MKRYVVRMGAQYLIGFPESDAWSTNPFVAFPFTDEEAAQRAAERINGQKLGNSKAHVEPASADQRA